MTPWVRFALVLMLSAIMGCGSSTVPSSSAIGADVTQRFALSVIGAPLTTSITLPEQFTDAEWSVKKDLCQHAGYDLLPYAGQSVSLTRFEISEKYYPNVIFTVVDYLGVSTTRETSPLPLYLWVLSKEGATVGAYVTVKEEDMIFLSYLHLGIVTSGTFAVDDAHIR